MHNLIITCKTQLVEEQLKCFTIILLDFQVVKKVQALSFKLNREEDLLFSSEATLVFQEGHLSLNKENCLFQYFVDVPTLFLMHNSSIPEGQNTFLGNHPTPPKAIAVQMQGIDLPKITYKYA